MGTVFLGEDPKLGRKVAIKVPRVTGPEPDHAQQRFLREARAAAAVRHEHVCPIYDVGEFDGMPFVVMAYVEGESLAEHLKRVGRFADVRTAVTLAAEVAEGLAAVHAAGIVHRDLKPANILIDTKGKAFVTDFGLARLQDVTDGLTPEGAILGTPAYMAPEQVDEHEFGPVTARSDVYSLGVVLYQMLTGRRPFEGPSPSNILYQIVHADPPEPQVLRPDLDPVLADLVMCAMAQRPGYRFFADAGEMAAALRDWLQGRIPPRGQTESLQTVRAGRSRMSERARMGLTVAASPAAGLPRADGVPCQPRPQGSLRRLLLRRRRAAWLGLLLVLVTVGIAWAAVYLALNGREGRTPESVPPIVRPSPSER
jgi:serine/threonine protein kinase